MTVDDRPVISRQRLADQVYAVLRGQILARELVPGDHLSVPVLAESLGLSRSPVREAVQRRTLLLELMPGAAAALAVVAIAARMAL